MARSISEIEADMAETRKAYTALLRGTRPQSMEHGERKISFGSNFAATRDALLAEMAALKAELARLQGRPSPRRPLGV